MAPKKEKAGPVEKVKDLEPKDLDVKGGKRQDWTIGHVTDVKFPK